MKKSYFTSESVMQGHPDKLCDQIADGILDAILSLDPMSRVACYETPELMPFPVVLAHRLARQVDLLRKSGELIYLRPDGK